MVALEIERPARAKPHRGLASRYQSLTAETATIEAASCVLFGEAPKYPNYGSHRGDYLRYLLRALYGADYRRRGAKLLGVSLPYLSTMMATGSRVSRRRVQRLEAALARRVRRRREELRALAAIVTQAFEREAALLSELDAVVSELNRLASKAVAATQPIDGRSGRFVPRVQKKFPMLRDRLSD